MPSKSQAPAPILVDPKQAAELLCISPRKLWSLTFETDPPLPHLKLGRLVRYRLSDLETYIEAMLKGGQG